MGFRAADLRQHGWTLPHALQIPDWCGCSTEYLPVPAGDGLVVSRADLGADADTQPPAPLGARGAPYWAADPRFGGLRPSAGCGDPADIAADARRAVPR